MATTGQNNFLSLPKIQNEPRKTKVLEQGQQHPWNLNRSKKTGETGWKDFSEQSDLFGRSNFQEILYFNKSSNCKNDFYKSIQIDFVMA